MIYALCAVIALSSATACEAAASSLYLDNGRIRIEVDPDNFSVRFIGAPGERNLIEPAATSESRHGAAMAYPGGVFADVAVNGVIAPPLRTAAAQVVAHSADSITLLGPVDEATGLQVKKVFRIHPRRPEAEYIVTVLSTVSDPVGVTLHTVAAIPANHTIEGDGAMDIVEGPARFVWPGESGQDDWRLHTPLSPRPTKLVRAQGNGHTTRVTGPGGTWTRTADEATACEFRFDPATASHGVPFITEVVAVSASEPAEFRETWRVDPPEAPHG